MIVRHVISILVIKYRTYLDKDMIYKNIIKKFYQWRNLWFQWKFLFKGANNYDELRENIRNGQNNYQYKAAAYSHVFDNKASFQMEIKIHHISF